MEVTKKLLLEKYLKCLNIELPEEEDIDNQDDIETRRELLRWENGTMKGMLSHSSLEQFSVSPRRYERYKLKQRTETAAMLTGTLFHCLTLEPESYEGRYYDLSFPLPKSVQERSLICALAAGYDPEEAWGLSGYTGNYYVKNGDLAKAPQDKIESVFKDGKQLSEFLKNMPDNVRVVAASTADKARELSKAVLLTRPARELIETVQNTGGTFERFLKWEHRGVRFRGMVDGEAIQNAQMTLDLKQMGRDSSPRKVRSSIDYGGMASQQSHYALGLAAETGISIEEAFDAQSYIIAIDMEMDVSVVEITRAQKSNALWSINYFIDEWIKCCMSGRWDESREYYAPTEHGIY